MKAAHLTSSGRKLGLAKVAREQGECSILIAKRFYGWDKSADLFLTGCGNSDYGVAPGDEVQYTIDTGMGYTHRDSKMVIQHVLQINADGKVVSRDGIACPPRDIPKGECENRYTWVMK
jgi:hypothetical protein